MNINDIRYRCCFCNEMIQSTDVDPCDLNILNNIDKPRIKQSNQSFYCHALCLQNVLHEKIKGYLVIHISDD